MASLYPGALDTNDSLYVAVNNTFALLNAQVDSNATTLLMSVPTGAPATGAVTIKGEAIKYTGKTSTSLTGCVRGYDGTAKAPHYVNDEVDFGPIADHHNAVVQAIQAIESKLGTGANFPSATVTASIANASITPAKLTNLYKARATNASGGAGQALAATVMTKVTFNTITYDTNNNFSTVNSRYTAAIAGTYSVKAVVPFTNQPASNRRIIVALFKNGAEYSRAGAVLTGGGPGGSYGNVPFSDDIVLAVNDYIEIWAYSAINDTIMQSAVGDYASFSIALQP